MPALEFLNVGKAFGAVQALRDVSFNVREGEAHAVVGENGAGKSTLLKILAGITQPDAGAVRLNDQPFSHANPRDALAAGVGMVFQERLAFPNLTVAGNIFAGREITTRGGRLDEAAMHERTAALLRDLTVPVTPATPMEHLSAAHGQLVQVARALAFDCRVLVLDEPTTSLTDAEVEHLFDILLKLKARGVTILFVSHRLPEVFRLCDRITVLRDGSFVGTFESAAATTDQIVRAMVGREPPERVIRSGVDRSGTPAIAARSLSRRGWFENITVEVWPGEIVGIFGLVGSGRTELLETMFGLARPSGGRIERAGKPVVFLSARDAARAGVGLVPEDRQRFGLHFNLNVAHNAVLADAARRGLGRIDQRREAVIAGTVTSGVALRTRSLQAMPDELSGGNQQKLVAAKWLAIEPAVLLLDEPTKGVDVGAKFQIHNLIRDRAAAGMACLVVSSELPELLALADRILVMREGRAQGELLAAEATEESVMQLATHDTAATA